LFPHEDAHLTTKEKNLPFSEGAFSAKFQTVPSSSDSVPARQFMNMPAQDLSIWTPSLMAEALVRTFRESFEPAKLSPVAIRKDDRA
jgi:hypothetical protein